MLDFSKHETPEDRNQHLDQNTMDDNEYIDFYLVNNLGNLRVSRRAEQNMSNPGQRGPTIDLVTGLWSPKPFFHLSLWEGPDGKPLIARPRLVNEYYQKHNKH
jgi:hypothetical protein